MRAGSSPLSLPSRVLHALEVSSDELRLFLSPCRAAVGAHVRVLQPEVDRNYFCTVD
jgi:hypothetical protein